MIRREFLRASALATASALVSYPALSAKTATSKTEEFHIAIPQSALDRILQHINDADLPDYLAAEDWSTGVDGSYMESFRQSWINDFNWRSVETSLNRHPQFKTSVDGQIIDFYHVVGKRPDGGPPPRPIMLIHGWPYSRFALAGLIDRLSDPGSFGGGPNEALTVVAPSLPGSGFSTKFVEAPKIRTVAARFQQLMTEVLGYSKFGLQGGDHGHVIATYMAHDYPVNISGLHLSMIPTPDIANTQVTPAVESWRLAKDAFISRAFSYFWLQADRPTAIAYAMINSPIGLAAWFIDKFYAWTDLASSGGNVDLALGNLKDPKLGRSRIISEVMTYLVSGSAASRAFQACTDSRVLIRRC